MTERKFSVFSNASGEKIGDLTLKEIRDIVIEDKETMNHTQKLRELMQEHGYDSPVVSNYKKKHFNMFKPLGVFTELGGKGFVKDSFSGFCPFDIDKKDHKELDKKEWDDLFLRIQSNPHVQFVMESPRQGIKGCILIDYNFVDGGDWYTVVTELVYPQFAKEWGVKFDNGQARMHMGQFLSHDPYAEFKEAEPFVPNETLRPTTIAPKYSKDNFRIKEFQYLLDRLKVIQGGSLFTESVKIAAVAAKMVKGGSLPITPDDAKYLMWECLKHAPGVSIPRKARSDMWNMFDEAYANAEYAAITENDLAFKELIKELISQLRYVTWKEDECPYIAVGNDFFWVTPPNVAKKKGTLVVRKPETIRRKHPRPKGFDALAQIPFYEDFISKPDFLNYEKIVDGIYYNEASPLGCEPQKGEWFTIEKYVKQLFSSNSISNMDQVEMFYDLLKLMIEHPEKKVPIMALVSRGQGTGKSFAFELLKLIFGEDNCKMITYKNFISQYNRSWANKYIVFIDEIPENKSEEFYTSLKEITYQNTIDVTEKYMTTYEIDNYIHFFLTTNNVDSFVKIEDQDSRMWIREVPKIEKHQYDKQILQKFKTEASCFLHFLMNRAYVNEIDHRFAFDKDLYRTERWAKVVENQKSHIYHHLKDKIREDFERNMLASQDHVYKKEDLKEMMDGFNYKWGVKDLTRAMEVEFGVEYKNNTGNRKGYLITRNMVDADGVQSRNQTSDQSNAFQLV
jgi:hypothetical protein